MYTGGAEKQRTVGDTRKARRQQHFPDFPRGIVTRRRLRQIAVGASIAGKQHPHRHDKGAQVEVKERPDQTVLRLARFHDDVASARSSDTLRPRRGEADRAGFYRSGCGRQRISPRSRNSHRGRVVAWLRRG